MADSKITQGERVQIMKLHHLRSASGTRTVKTRISRGEDSKGKTAGRGMKGTKARYQVSVGFKGDQMPTHMYLPKLRGFRNPLRVEYQVTNVIKLTELLPEGGKVMVEGLITKHAVRDNVPVKVLGSDELTVKLEAGIGAQPASAAEEVQATGGTISAR